jgi:hypothetical protein
MVFRCPICRTIWHNPNDEREAYCGRCHTFPSDAVYLPERTTAFARAAYRNDSFPARLCDHCGTPYRGPAVYCSLECAVADA